MSLHRPGFGFNAESLGSRGVRPLPLSTSMMNELIDNNHIIVLLLIIIMIMIITTLVIITTVIEITSRGPQRADSCEFGLFDIYTHIL